MLLYFQLKNMNSDIFINHKIYDDIYLSIVFI